MNKGIGHTTRLLVTSRSSSGFHSIVSSTCASALLCRCRCRCRCPVRVVGRRASSTSRRGVVDGVEIEVVRLGDGMTMEEEMESTPAPAAPEIPRLVSLSPLPALP